MGHYSPRCCRKQLKVNTGENGREELFTFIRSPSWMPKDHTVPLFGNSNVFSLCFSNAAGPKSLLNKN